MTTPTSRARDAADQWIRDFADLVIVGAADKLDLGDLISAGLAQAARELGGVSHIVAGRPGSWEAHDLLHLALARLAHDEPAADVDL
jgi:hypothetical protein